MIPPLQIANRQTVTAGDTDDPTPPSDDVPDRAERSERPPRIAVTRPMDKAFGDDPGNGIDARAGTSAATPRSRFGGLVVRDGETGERIVDAMTQQSIAMGAVRAENGERLRANMMDLIRGLGDAFVNPDKHGEDAMRAADSSSGVISAGHRARAMFYALIEGVKETARGDFSNLTFWRPDGHGVTIEVVGQEDPIAFRYGKNAEAYIRDLPEGSIRDIIFYGHGAPGMIQIENGYPLDAEAIAKLLSGKMTSSGAIHVVGCNTASVGYEGLEDSNVFTGAGYGLATLTRRLTYFSLPVIVGGADKDVMEEMWNEDLARQVSQSIRDVTVYGQRTFAFPADRLVPASTNATPSRWMMSREAAYRNGQTVEDD